MIHQNKIIDGVLHLLYHSENSTGVARGGCYGLNKEIFKAAIKEYLLTGFNPLPEYDSLIFLSWSVSDSVSSSMPAQSDITLWENAIIKQNYWNIYGIFEQDEINKISEYIEYYKRKYYKQSTYKSRRQQANSYIQRKDVRERIFRKCDFKCQDCESIENLSIDHIVSVYNGGSNNDENLRVLCRSCNSKKGGRFEK